VLVAAERNRCVALLGVHGGEPEFAGNLKAAHWAGVEIEKAVRQAIAAQKQQLRIPETVLKMEPEPGILVGRTTTFDRLGPANQL
jgi:hypothetical protein